MKQQDLSQQLSRESEATADHLSDQLTYQLEANHHKFLLQQQVVNQELTELRRELYQHLTEIRQELNQSLLQNRDATDQRLQALQTSNEKRLEEMRQTVEEKLEKTLQTRLQASLRLFPSSWNRSTEAWARCKMWPAMSAPSTRSSPIPRPEGLWASCSWVRLSKIS